MTLDEVIAAVRDNAEASTALPAYQARLLVAEIERLRAIVGDLSAGLQIIAENPDWHDHPTRAADVLARVYAGIPRHLAEAR